MFAHLRGKIGRGLLLVLPTLVTLWLLALLFKVIDDNVTPAVLAVLRAAGVPGLELWPAKILVPLIGVVLTGSVIYLIGLLAGNLVGRRILTMIEGGILRLPLVKTIYRPTRQLLDAFSMTGTKAFSKVVLLEYPRRDLWTVGFVTTERLYELPGGSAHRNQVVPVFLPTTPNPTSGWMILAAPQDLLVLDTSIEDAVKLIVSGGIVGPEDFADRVRPWPLTGSLPPETPQGA